MAPTNVSYRHNNLIVKRRGPLPSASVVSCPFIGCGGMLIAACTIIVCMVKMYRATLHRERSGDQFRFSRPSANDNQSRNLSNTMRSQGSWYSGAFLFTFFPGLLLVLGINVEYISKRSAQLLLVSLPLNVMGFNNAVMYVRPRFLKFCREHPNLGVVSSLWYTLVRARPVRREDQEYTHRSTAHHTTSENHQAALPSMTSSLAVEGERHPPSESFVLTGGQD